MKSIFAAFVLLAALAFAPSPPPRAQEAGAAGSFSQAELDQMLAPVALYPDALLAQVLAAATYPLEVVEASRWSQAHADLAGADASNAAAEQGWDPSVKTLLAFPDLLRMLNDKLDWTERLGAAFMGQQTQVMDTIQSLRHKAQSAGTLDSGGELRVSNDDGSIGIEPAAPDLVYLPYYDPNTAYGTWWWPAYPPVYWSAWPAYGWSGGFAWGSGVAIGTTFFTYDLDWRKRHITVYDHGRPWHRRGYYAGTDTPRVWQHDPGRGRGAASGYAGRTSGQPNPAATAGFPMRETGGALPPSGMAMPRGGMGGVNQMPAAQAPQRGYAPGPNGQPIPQRAAGQNAPVLQPPPPLQQPPLQQPQLQPPPLMRGPATMPANGHP